MIPHASRSARLSAGVGRAALLSRRLPGGFCATISLLALAFAAGCSSSGTPEAKSPEDDRVAQLERENTQLNERLARLERERDEAVAAAQRASKRPVEPEVEREGASADATRGSDLEQADERAENSTRPVLTIVKLGPDGAESVIKRAPSSEADAEEEEPEPRLRPVLRVHGSEQGGVAHVVESDSEPPGQSVVLAPEGGSSGAETTPALSEAEKKKMRAIAAAAAEYETALSAVRQKNYAKAEPGLRRFLARHADHPYSDNALYWLGECQFQRGDYAGARDSFANVEARYPSENKVPDALLKLALSYERLGQTDEAKKTFERLLAAHPDTAAARRIPETHSSK
jgi:tol-pal system protein YbgF